MPKTTKTVKTAKVDKTQDLSEMKVKLVGIRLTIKAGQEKNTNAHKALKKEIAQLLTKSNKK
jgi:ribosomal protein L29